MGIKYFCDVCGVETKRNYVSERLKPELLYGEFERAARCEVTVAINGAWNGGVICERCLRRVLSQLDREE